MKKMMMMAIMLAGALVMAQYPPPAAIVLPDTIELGQAGGSVCFAYSTDCEGHVDLKAVYTWENEHTIVQQNIVDDGTCLALSESGQVRLTITGSNGQSVTSNWSVVVVNSVALHIQEWVQGEVVARFRIVDVHGREVAADKKVWSELPSGVYALWFDDGTVLKLGKP